MAECSERKSQGDSDSEVCEENGEWRREKKEGRCLKMLRLESLWKEVSLRNVESERVLA